MGRERLGQVAPSDLAEDFPWQGRPQALGKRLGGGVEGRGSPGMSVASVRGCGEDASWALQQEQD